MAEKVKRAVPDVFIIFGGVHPTIFADEVISHKFIDAICLGEGEYPMLELCNAMHAGKDISNIRNLWIKDLDGTIHKNPSRTYVQDLDALKMDREGLFYYGIFSGRGCIGNCSFCNTPAIKRSGGTGKYLRKHSVDYILDEIKAVLRNNIKYMVRRFISNPRDLRWVFRLTHAIRRPSVRFKDDSFLASKSWFLDFAKGFSKRFRKVTYLCNARADEIDEQVGELLRKSRCERVGIGFECGNEKYRNDILNKRVSNEDIISCSKILRRNKIPILGQWMIGLPGETIGDVIESLELSMKIGDIPQIHIAQPFPKTEMHRQAVEMGLIDEDYIPSQGVYSDIVLHNGEIKQVMKMVYRLFSLKDMKVPEDLEIFNHTGRLRDLANMRLGDIMLDRRK